jgi:hypothetical protein
MRNRVAPRAIVTLSGVALVLGAASWALAEGSFFRVSPGPLSESHADLDNSESCAKCHETNRGVPDTKCLDCHKTLRDRIAHKQGLHATFSGKCIQCHPGHKGRTTSIIDWKYVGGQQTFKHDLTTFSLTNQHAQTACTACHTKKRKSGRISYLGLDSDCKACHKGVHKLTQVDLASKCELCHAPGQAAKGMRLSEWSDQHAARTKLLLAGRHLDQPCTKCHPKAEMARREPPRGCADCHHPSHPITPPVANCSQCHKEDQHWKNATVDHRRFGFALLGKHAGLDCKRCHVRGTTLTYSVGACSSCHEHRNAHQRQFADKPCESCHIEGGTRTLPFDHNKDTRYPLLGFHAEPKVRTQCAGCHPQRIYRTGKLGCADCHRDTHNGQLGADCTRCHSVTQRLKEARATRQHIEFPLEGLHRQVKCESCHPGGKYKLGNVSCADCHAKSDPHRGKLGTACEHCHTPVKGAPRFDHERMTKFPRTGAHLHVQCGFCHQARPELPLEVGWIKKQPSPKLDHLFPVMGKRCADCHADPHKGSAGSECQQCHNTASFGALLFSARLARPTDHDRGWLRKHTVLPFDDHQLAEEGRSCNHCHGTPSCDRCHRVMTPKSHTASWRLRGHGTAAVFDPESCRTCHLTGTCVACHRTTRPLNHRGAWNKLHGYAVGSFADSNCYVCHSRGDCFGCHPPK